MGSHRVVRSSTRAGGDARGAALKGDPARRTPARAVMDALRRLVRGLRVFDRAAERAAGLSAAQLFVLSKLADGRAASVNELAERTHTHQSSVSVVAQRLVDRGLVRRARSEADGRRVELALTAAGRRALRRAPASAQDKLIDALGRLRPADRDDLVRLMEAWVAEAGLAEDEATMFFEEADDPPYLRLKRKPPVSRRRADERTRR